MPKGIEIRHPHSFAYWLVQQRKRAGFRTQQAFIDAFKRGSGNKYVSPTTIKKIESGAVSGQLTEGVLQGLAEKLKLDYSEILAASDHFLTFEDILNLSSDIGKQLLATIRSNQTSDLLKGRSLLSLYRRIVTGALADDPVTFSLEIFLRELATRTTLEALETSIPPPALEIVIDDYFKELQFRWGAANVTVLNPPLLWPCSCQTQGHPEHNTDCAIHSSPDGIHIERSFMDDFVAIRWRGLRFLWKNETDLFPPSVDSFHMLTQLESAGLFRYKGCRTLLDLGSGTGFLGIAIATFNRNVRQVSLADWLPTPLLFSMLNWNKNLGLNGRVKAEPRLGLHTNWLMPPSNDARRFDVVVCNPPYLPLSKHSQKLGMESTVAGTDLLRHVIEHGRRIGDRVYFQFSSLVADEIGRLTKTLNIRLRPVGEPKRVPFRVRRALEDQLYLDWLIQERDLEVDSTSPYKYFHAVQTYSLG